MKIISGIFRGRNFYMPADIRPTQNLVRGALFDMIGESIQGASFADFFSGSGAVGLEALSRGAARVVCVEREAKNAALIRENMGLLKEGVLGATGILEVVARDAFSAIKLFAAQKQQFDFVFVDPPYGRELAKKALKTLGGYDILHTNSTLIIQHDAKEILPETAGRINCFRQRKYGATFLSFYKTGT
jgi:16S rRNA (guanine(966)-N(2))-methyltransferase RsmD